MKSNAIKMMIFLVATALLCFGTTMNVSASVDNAEDSAVAATDEDGASMVAPEEEAPDENSEMADAEDDGAGDAESDVPAEEDDAPAEEEAPESAD